MLVVILFFPLDRAPAIPHPQDAELLIDMWTVTRRLASTGLFLEQEYTHSSPPWKQWAIVSARRRTIQSFHHLDWAWSLLHGYPTLTCFELGPLPAPAAGYLWREGNERTWQRLYGEWLHQWEGGSYKMAELFHLSSSGSVDRRTEMWLAEVDEFGMVLMAEGKLSPSLMASLTARGYIYARLTSTSGCYSVRYTFKAIPAHPGPPIGVSRYSPSC